MKPLNTRKVAAHNLTNGTFLIASEMPRNRSNRLLESVLQVILTRFSILAESIPLQKMAGRMPSAMQITPTMTDN